MAPTARSKRRRRASHVLRDLALIGLAMGIAVAGIGAVRLNQSPHQYQHGPLDDRSVEHWEQAWSDVLAHHVDAQGRVDFSGLERDPAGLDRVVRFIAAIYPVSSPDQFPTLNSRLAYYIDAYNALAMYGVTQAGVPKRFGWLGRVRFFILQRFVVGGRSISLYHLENGVIRPLGDPRVHFALNCMSVSCPRLPQAAFTPAGLDHQLEAAAREFIADPRNVNVDAAQREVRLSAIFKFYTQDFLSKAPSLLAYINQYRVAQIPIHYSVAFDNYDWSINDQPHK